MKEGIGVIKAKPYLRVRDKPSLKGRIIGSVKYNSTIYFDDIAVDEKGIPWLRIKDNGWVCSAYVEIKKPPEKEIIQSTEPKDVPKLIQFAGYLLSQIKQPIVGELKAEIPKEVKIETQVEPKIPIGIWVFIIGFVLILGVSLIYIFKKGGKK